MLAVAPAPEAAEDDDDDGNLREALAAWLALALEADALQEAGYFAGESCSAAERASARARANAHWTHHGPRLFMLEHFIRKKLAAIPGTSPLFLEPDVRFFVRAVYFHDSESKLRHLYRRPMRRDSESDAWH